MLMDCLAEGRGISLPALSVSAGKGATEMVGAYARIRKQFKVPIAELEGVQEHLARIAGNTYIMTSAQFLCNSMINQHEQPAVISAIMKQQLTHRMRNVINDAMDVMGGAGICNGPANFLANGYQAIPIAITVEGANTLTRTLIQYGQGLTRSHPHLLHIIQSIQNGNDLAGFRQHALAAVGHAFTSGAQSFTRSLLRSHSKSNVSEYYESQLNRLASSFAFAADVSLTLGGKIKFAEYLSGRYADVLSNLYLGYATLWYHSQHPSPSNEKVLDYALGTIIYDIQEAFFGIFRNFPIRPLAWTMQAAIFPWGRSYNPPSDRSVKQAAEQITTETDFRKLIQEGMYLPKDIKERTALILHAFPKCIEADKLLSRLKKEKRQPTSIEKAVIDEAEAYRQQIIQVDSHPLIGKEANVPGYRRPALDDIYNSDVKAKVA